MPKKIFKIFLKTFLIFISILILYTTAALTLPLITVNRSYQDSPDGVKIFVLSNGVHTDIAVPAKNGVKDWTIPFLPDSFDVKDPAYSFVGFGWGDKGFYLETQTWDKLNTSTVLKASCGLGGTAMHVHYLKERKKETTYCELFTISTKQYQELIHFIEESFKKDKHRFIKINHPGYGELDRFYEAKGTYSLFKTCNCWVNNGLKTTGIRTAWWSPFSGGLMQSVKH